MEPYAFKQAMFRMAKMNHVSVDVEVREEKVKTKTGKSKVVHHSPEVIGFQILKPVLLVRPSGDLLDLRKGDEIEILTSEGKDNHPVSICIVQNHLGSKSVNHRILTTFRRVLDIRPYGE